MPAKKSGAFMSEYASSSDRKAELLSVLGDEKRLQILSILLDNDMSVTELTRRVEISQSAPSQHLAKRRQSQLVETRREAQTIYYSTQNARVRAILEVLETLYDTAKSQAA